LPLFVGAEKALRASGMSGTHLDALLNEMAQSMFKTFGKGARVNYARPLTAYSPQTARTYLDSLRRVDPQFAEFVTGMLVSGARVPSKAKIPQALCNRAFG